MNNLDGNSEIQVGDIATITRIYMQTDVEAYALLTGDYNPIHFDYAYAEKTIFKKPIIHGPLITTLMTTLFANKLPGPGSVYLSHELKYLSPVFVNDAITARLEVMEITDRKHIILKTTCINQDGKIVIDGIAKLKFV